MSNWTRIGDDEVATFGKQVFEFEASEGRYWISVDQDDQEYISVVYGTDLSRWPVMLKHSDFGSFQLCGMADTGPPLPLGGCWYELVFGSAPEITYWLDQVIFRRDRGRIAALP